MKLEKECVFPDLGTELPISKVIKRFTDRKSRDKLLEEKDLNVPEVVEQIQQKTDNRRNRKKTRREALTSNREKEIKEEPKHKTYTRKYEKRPKERQKQRSFRYWNAANWNPNQRCLAPEPTCQKCKKKERTFC